MLQLPPDSPDLNPIGLAFSRLKRLLCDAGARSKPALWKLFKRLLTEFSPAECAGYIRQRGFGHSGQ